MDSILSEIIVGNLSENSFLGNFIPRTAVELIILLQNHFFIFFLDKTRWNLYTLLDNWIVDKEADDLQIVREIEPESIAFASKSDVNRTLT